MHEPTYSIALLGKANEAASYLTDGAGRALYSFARDTVGTPTATTVTACTSARCMTNWPIFLTDQVVMVPCDLVAADFTAYTGADGMQQCGCSAADAVTAVQLPRPAAPQTRGPRAFIDSTPWRPSCSEPSRSGRSAYSSSP